MQEELYFKIKLYQHDEMYDQSLKDIQPFATYAINRYIVRDGKWKDTQLNIFWVSENNMIKYFDFLAEKVIQDSDYYVDHFLSREYREKILLIQQGRDPNKLDSNGQTWLFNSSPRYGSWTPIDKDDCIDYNFVQGHLLLFYLLKNGADPNIKNNCEFSFRKYTLHKVAIISFYENYGPNMFATWLLLYYGADPNIKYEGGYPCLGNGEVITGTNYHTLQILIRYGADIPEYAIYNQTDIRSIDLLLKNGANIDCVLCNITPLMLACGKHEVEVVEFLLKRGANPHFVNKRGETALDWALYHRNEIEFKIIQLLFDCGVQQAKIPVFSLKYYQKLEQLRFLSYQEQITEKEGIINSEPLLRKFPSEYYHFVREINGKQNLINYYQKQQRDKACQEKIKELQELILEAEKYEGLEVIREENKVFLEQIKESIL